MPVTRDTRGRFAPEPRPTSPAPIDLKCLEGLRTWNIQDTAFVGVVVVPSERHLSVVLHEIMALKLMPIRLIDWHLRRIVFENGGEIRVRVVSSYEDAYRLSGHEYWAVCFLSRIPDDAYRFVKSRIRVPATHKARKYGVRSRDELAAERVRRSATPAWVDELIKKPPPGTRWVDGWWMPFESATNLVMPVETTGPATFSSRDLDKYDKPTLVGQKPTDWPTVNVLRWPELPAKPTPAPKAPEVIQTTIKPVPIFDAAGKLVGATFPAIDVPVGGKVFINMTVARNS